MKMPLIIMEDKDIQFFNKISDAQSKIESIDAQNNVYKGYDADGKLLKIAAIGSSVKITLAEHKTTQKSQLIEALHEFLSECNELDDDKKYKLEELLEKCQKYFYIPPKSFFEALKSLFGFRK